MKLRIAVIVKARRPSVLKRKDRHLGWWSYPVPEFTWEFFGHDPYHPLPLRRFKSAYDLVFVEDPAFVELQGTGLPTAYLTVDSTLSETNHYAPRFKHAQQFDLVLVDHDEPKRFTNRKGKRAARLPYCVNEKIFYDYQLPKVNEIAYHCSGGHNTLGQVDRALTRRWLHTWSAEHEASYRSGVLGLKDYARSMASSKVVVNVPRTLINRNHRILDAMACKACVVSAPFAAVKTDKFVVGTHYLGYEDFGGLDRMLHMALQNGDETWQRVAEDGYQHVMAYHTWATRATELRQTLAQELGL